MRSVLLKIILSVSVLFLFQSKLSAQYPENKDGLTLKFLMLDYYSPFAEEPVYEFQNLNYGAEIGYFRSLNKFLNIGFPLRVGLANLPMDTVFSDDILLASLDAVLQLHLMKKGALLNPYLNGGAGATVDEEGNFNAHYLGAAGLNLRFSDAFYLQLQTDYRMSLEENRDHWHHSAGFLFLMGGNKRNKKGNDQKESDRDGDGVPDSRDLCPFQAGSPDMDGCPDSDGDGLSDAADNCPNIPGPPSANGCPDSDGDGILDDADQCPDEAGEKNTQGCPDSDGDGVADKDDDCPNEYGSSTTEGCPDSDGDGIPDKLDDCPDERGSTAASGCPDSDGDGVPDKLDDCPDDAGALDNNGCPGINEEDRVFLEEAQQAVEFDLNTASLRPQSYSVLDRIVMIMNKYKKYRLQIEGHTDSVGSSAFNLNLSRNRAKACYDYLVSKGISSSRLTYEGYGESRPIADNDYPEGQRLNRRVEFIISND